MRYWQQAWQAVQAQPRVLVGLTVLIVLAWLAAWLEVDVQVAALRTEAKQLEARLARLTALATETHWEKTREASRLLLAQFRARTWRGESEGRIQAAFQDWLREGLAAAGIKPRELAVSQPTPGIEPGTEDADLWPAEMRLVRARIVMDFVPQALLSWLAELATEERWLRLERLKIVNQARDGTAEVELSALYVIGTQEEP